MPCQQRSDEDGELPSQDRNTYVVSGFEDPGHAGSGSARWGRSVSPPFDIYRGFVMFLMVAEVLHLSSLAKNYPDNPVWKEIAFHTQHVEWVGCSLHDMIQPSFSFLVGVALPFSLANRIAKGESFKWLTLHALWRSLVLVLLGVFLRSTHSPITNWTFEDTLTQIGLGYFFLFLLGWMKSWVVWVSFFLIVIGYWDAWALYPPAALQ